MLPTFLLRQKLRKIGEDYGDGTANPDPGKEAAEEKGSITLDEGREEGEDAVD